MDQTSFIQILLTIIGSALASSGFWAYITSRNRNKSAEARMLIGLAHDRIMSLSLEYINRGWITKDEYENLHKYLYEPYEDLKGNGSARRIMTEVNKLPIKYGGVNYSNEKD